MRESKIEAECRKLVEANSGAFLKTQSVSHNGYPDRHIVFPERGLNFYVEFKRSHGSLSEYQSVMIDALNKSGARTYVCRSVSEFKKVLRLELGLEYDN